MRVYDLPETGEGVRFYEFESTIGDGSKAGEPEMRQIKDWYRGGIDAGVGEDEKLKGEEIDHPTLGGPWRVPHHRVYSCASRRSRPRLPPKSGIIHDHPRSS
jgi:hypothetical protein